MSPEKTQHLFDSFPRLYRGRELSASASLMAQGFECEDGWFALICTLSSRLEDIAHAEGRQPQSDDWPEALQVKEKLGRLRFYTRHTSPTMHAAIADTQALSETTCEVCGQSNARQVGNRTRCGRHA
ncbi:hypothetical protein [Noviherbaspirillum autotrophicum]|uniref:Uncharacterized protein n=1 Tax=Noviherbaspirillum autotrophicum TaxID=709839 RepID=A0A0C1YRJ3_9BURK|nr:hypothetical protein [Noviherbaspirillum autotrophicum]KIF83292.1 hypothetical protein TSA66_24610 [Noviherbaspirillum autotrophicum]